jgi:hypothetical protein
MTMPIRQSPRKSTDKTVGRVLLLLLVIGSTGCDSQPSAPALEDSPVYHNKQEGFRFLVPEGWTQNASALLPPGQLEGENFLVRYRMKTPEQGATLQILCFDDSDGADLREHHAGPSFRVQRWKPDQPGETIDVNGVKAERHAYTAVMDGRRMMKEVVCFRRGNRVYSFVALFYATDDKAREQVRRAVASVIWET